MKGVRFYIHALFFVPHILCYFLMKDAVLKDLAHWKEVIGLLPYKDCNMKAYLWFVINVKEYRNVLYFRLGRMGRILSLFAPPMPTCFLTGVLPQTVGSGLVIQHGHSMRLGAERVGEKLQIWHNVTVGKIKSGGRLPRIGDNVRIYTGAVVLGDIDVGDNVQIGACTLVMKSVPSNCVVVGNPARIVYKDGNKCNIPL